MNRTLTGLCGFAPVHVLTERSEEAQTSFWWKSCTEVIWVNKSCYILCATEVHCVQKLLNDDA